MTKKAHVLNTGCPISRIDSAQVVNFLKRNDWNIVSDFRKADLIIFRACALIEKNEKISLDIIRKIKSEKKSDARFIVWGCLHKINPEALKIEYEGITFSEREIDVLNEIIDAETKIQEIKANFLIPNFELPPKNLYEKYIVRIPNFLLNRLHIHYSIARTDIPIFHILTSTGCLGNCTFCAVRLSRGVLRSKSIDKILEEFRDGLIKGFKYFSLLATDLGAYGRDQGHTLVDLLNEMTKENGDYYIALRNVEPHFFIEMFEELRPFFSSRKIWFLSSSVESGSNRILRLMGRKYKVEDFIKCIKNLNCEYPNILLKTQIIVGFPTETDEDFKKSIQLLDNVKFNWVELYNYSKRPGTLAAKMDGQIPDEVKFIRYLRLLLKLLSQNILEKYISRT